jgi:hypothetical protein
MTVLSREERNALDVAVQEARRKAEGGAENALLALGVQEERKPAYLTEEQAELRRRLRAECRRLGSFDDLVRSMAYEQWHRMLFARFLAENRLLIHPEFKVPVTLEECEEIAREEGRDLWEVAAGYAAWMLPGIFRQESPLTQVRYAAEDASALEAILSGIPEETFQAGDALGWTYQFWQTEEKKEVNASEKKIEGYDICAVTQLFTEPYMVQFLLQNTLGAWWLDRHPESPLRAEWVYYKDQVQHDFSAFPATAGDLKILDPACGSGHFLVEAFHMLLAMRQEEGESLEAAIAGIVRDNLHGLEIDPRCIQIAGFAVAMEAWKAGFPTDDYLPLPNLACVGLPIRAEKEEWLKLAGGDGLLEGELEKYYDLFKNADSLGSLIQIEEGGTLVPGEVLMRKLEKALAKEKATGDPVAEAFGETASGVLKAVQYLQRRDFHIVVTNPPFLSKGNQSNFIREFCDFEYSHFNNDLATSFIARCKNFAKKSGYYSLVTPLNWTFQVTTPMIRKTMLLEQRIPFIVKLGPRAFITISGEVVNVALSAFININSKPEFYIYGIDAIQEKNPFEKEKKLRLNSYFLINQVNQLKNPDYIIHFDTILKFTLLSNYAYAKTGIQTGDIARAVRQFWEITKFEVEWEYIQNTSNNTTLFGGRESIIWWQKGNGFLNNVPGYYPRGLSTLGEKGVVVSLTGKKHATLFWGDLFYDTAAVVIPKEKVNLPAVWCFISSNIFNEEIHKINPKLYTPPNTLVKIPFDLPHWQKVAEGQYPNGLPEPHSDDPTQWIFHGHPCGSVVWDEDRKVLAHGPLRTDGTVLHVAVARLLGYRWPAELDPDMELSGESRAWVAETESLLPFADQDGIVAIPSVRGEGRLMDRLREILAAAYGSEWSPNRENELLREAGYTRKDGSLKGDLEGFLRDDFFASHCKLFGNRPFIWQVWDGTKDGFSVLLNYHKLDRRNLERLTYTYLGAWIAQQRSEVQDEVPGAERRLAAAEDLKERLAKILEGEEPYDIFVRWKPLHEQPIGWDPDLNDGVRLNIRPFVEGDVLRSKPRIHWKKDRGKDPAPNASGTMERHNDRHLTLEEKRKARAEVEGA